MEQSQTINRFLDYGTLVTLDLPALKLTAKAPEFLDGLKTMRSF